MDLCIGGEIRVKIHIVQKGDTLWKIAKKYGVDFEELKKMNSQLSNPDMIMPGMKIKVPTTSGNIKKEAQLGTAGAKINMGTKKEMPIKEQPILPIKEQPILPIKEQPILPIKEKPIKKELPVQPVKEQPIQPVKEQPIMEKPVSPIENIPIETPKEQPKMPYMPKMPMPMVPEVDINNYFMMNMANIKAMEQTAPQLPPQPQVSPVKEEVKESPIKESPVMEAPAMEAPVEQYMPMYNPCFDPCAQMYNPCFDPCYPGQHFGYPQVQGAYMPQVQPQAYPQVQGEYMPQVQQNPYPAVQGAYMPQVQQNPYPAVQGAYMPQAYPQVQGGFMPQAQPMPYQGGLETGIPFQPTMMPGVGTNMNTFEESSPLMPPPMPQGQVPEGYGVSSFSGGSYTPDYTPIGNPTSAQPLMGMGEPYPYMPQTMQGQMPMMGYQPAPLPAQNFQPSMLPDKDCGCGGSQLPQPYGAYGMPQGFPPAPMQQGQMMMPRGFNPGAYPPPQHMGYGNQGFPPPQMFGTGYPNDFDNGNLFQRNDESNEFND
jgi:morphogenetic protein associated with SpoVID